MTSSTATSLSTWTTSWFLRDLAGTHRPRPSRPPTSAGKSPLPKAEKCELHCSTVQFLGFVVSRGKLEMDPSKTKAVVSWPTTTDRKELQRFLGFANFYCRFIRGVSSTVQPLTALTSTKVSFCWTPEADAAFTTLKTRFSKTPGGRRLQYRRGGRAVPTSLRR